MIQSSKATATTHETHFACYAARQTMGTSTGSCCWYLVIVLKEGTGKSKFLPCCLMEHSSWDGMSSGSCQRNKKHWSGRLLHQKLKSAEFLNNAGHVGLQGINSPSGTNPGWDWAMGICFPCRVNAQPILSYRGMQTRPHSREVAWFQAAVRGLHRELVEKWSNWTRREKWANWTRILGRKPKTKVEKQGFSRAE